MTSCEHANTSHGGVRGKETSAVSCTNTVPQMVNTTIAMRFKLLLLGREASTMVAVTLKFVTVSFKHRMDSH